MGWAGRKEGGCLTVEGVTASKVTRTLSLSPLRGKSAGKRQPGRGEQERGAAAPTRHNAPTDTRGSKQPKRKPNRKTHSEKPCAPPPLPSPKPELLIPATLPPKNKPKLFLAAFFFFLLSFYYFFFQKFWVFWSAGFGSAGQPFPPPLPPFWAPPMAAASPLTLSPRTAQPGLCRALEDGRRTRDRERLIFF